MLPDPAMLVAEMRQAAKGNSALRVAATDSSALRLQRQPGLVRASAMELRLALDLALHFL
jgi:hypothetical protein